MPVALMMMLLTGCGGHDAAARTGGGPAGGAGGAPKSAAKLTVTPGDGRSAVDPGSVVTVAVADGTLGSVSVAPAGKATDGVTPVEVTGALDAAKHTWRSDRTMTPGSTYTVQVTAADASGTTRRQRTTFRTLAAPKVNGVTVTPVGGAVVGVGQPVSLAFDQPVKDRAAVEKRLTVTTTPAVQGGWGWIRDPLTGTERVDWRPATYWAKGTKVTMTARLSGVDTGDGRYLRRDVTSAFTVGTARITRVDLRAHTMKVTEDGRTVRTVKISAGGPRFPTWNGRMVVLSKQSTIRMTSTSVGIADSKDSSDFYDKDVHWAVHLTTSGTFTHAAPWNTALFGKTNASHGCIGMSDADAKWFFGLSVRGDVVETTGSTRATVDKGNGYGDWNLTTEQWHALSALR